MSKIERCMIDIETVAHEPGGIWNVGIVTSGGAKRSWCCCPTVFDPDVLAWQLGQSDNVRGLLSYALGSRSLDVMLDGISNFFKDNPVDEVWSDDYDRRLLRAAYEGAGLDLPWYYRKERDFRTICSLAPKGEWKNSDSEGKAHLGLADACEQLEFLESMLKRITVSPS